MKTSWILITFFSVFFFFNSLKAQHRVAARIDSTGNRTYIVANKPEQTPINTPANTTPPQRTDTFKVQPATIPYRPSSPADRVRMEKYMLEQHKNSTEGNQ